MTRKDFELIASVIRDARLERPLFRPAWDYIAQDFARELRGTNSNFDRLRFLEACGVEDLT